jgi:hypothetical protein
MINEIANGLVETQAEEAKFNTRMFVKQDSDSCQAVSFKKPSRPKFDLTEKFKLLKPAADTLVETKLEFSKTTNFNSAQRMF